MSANPVVPVKADVPYSFQSALNAICLPIGMNNQLPTRLSTFQSALNAICLPIMTEDANRAAVTVSIRFKRDMSANKTRLNLSAGFVSIRFKRDMSANNVILIG